MLLINLKEIQIKNEAFAKKKFIQNYESKLINV